MEAVLRSQESYYANATADIQIMRRLIQVEVLYPKKQLSIVMKCLSKAEQLALRHDRIIELLRCYEWRSRIANATAKPRLTLTPEFLEQARAIADQCTRWIELRRLNNELWTIIHEAESITPVYRKQLKHIVNETHRFLNSGTSGSTLKKEAWSVLVVAYRFLDDWEMSYKYRKMFVGLYEENKTYLQHNSTEYIVAVGNLINACREMKKLKEGEQWFEKAKTYYAQLPARFKTLRLEERYTNLLNSYVSWLLNRNRFAEALESAEQLIPQVEKQNNVFQNSLLNILHDTLTHSAFYSRAWRKALQYHTRRCALRGKWHDAMTGLAILYESGNYDVLHYRARSFVNFLRKSGHNPEKRTVRWLTKNLPESNSRKLRTDAFLELNELLAGNDGELLRRYFGSFQYAVWIQSNIDSVPISDLLKPN